MANLILGGQAGEADSQQSADEHQEAMKQKPVTFHIPLHTQADACHGS